MIDTGAGISDNVTFFCSAAHDTIVIVTPEPTSIADAYALIKVLYKEYGEQNFRIVVNSVRNHKEAKETFKKNYLWLPKDFLEYQLIGLENFHTMKKNKGSCYFPETIHNFISNIRVFKKNLQKLQNSFLK